MNIIIVTISILFFVFILIVGRFLAYNDIVKRKIPNEKILKGYSFEKIEFPIDKRKILRGWFLKSPQNPSNRTLILLHGWQRNRTRIISQAKLFVDNGFHVVIYDQRSHGESDNALITFGKEESKDLLSCITYLKGKSDINIGELGAVGFSLGCGGLIYAAGCQKKPIFKAIVLEGAFANSYDTGKYMLQNKFGRILGYIIGLLFFTLGTKIASFGRFHHSKPYRFIGLIPNTPIMVIRGDYDFMVPKESIEKLIDSIKGEKIIWYNKKGRHTDSFIAYPEEYKIRVVGFLDQYIIK